MNFCRIYQRNLYWANNQTNPVLFICMIDTLLSLSSQALISTRLSYLQQQMFKVCIGFIRQLALNYQKGCYDERNKWASHLAAMAYDRLTEDNLIYDPEYTNFKKQ